MDQKATSSGDSPEYAVQPDHPSSISDAGGGESDATAAAQLSSLDPKVQAYLSQMSRESGCCNGCFPIPFERAARRSWWDPAFDSDILEDQYRKSSNPHHNVRFRYALLYLSAVSTIWLVYFLVVGFLGDIHSRLMVCSLLLVLIVSLTLSLSFTYTRLYHKHMHSITVAISLLLIMLSLIFLLVVYPLPVGNFSFCIQMLFLLYTLIPLRLYASLILGVVYSIAFELLVYFLERQQNYSVMNDITRLLCHLAIHIICFHICLMNSVRMRNTFMKVGQSLLVRRQLELEQRLKENMIHSLMPKSVADWLRKEDENFNRRHSNDSANDIRSLFRPFNMDHMEDVSILFADIVGFTKMSSTKSAEELVDILNSLFQRFDLLCKIHNCEKISTLGDCYYCVSGCPEARADHAQCCVEMGLSMIQAIKQFDEERSEGVNMRVGIHTGTVLCGIVGTRRFKFDVWSNDVTLANKMESTGTPGMVHVSEKTVNFLQDMYQLEEGEEVMGLKTYFIMGRKASPSTAPSGGSFRAEGKHKYANSLHLFVSPPPPSPARPRVLSCDETSSRPYQRHLLSPDPPKVKASSLPSILDVENDDGTCASAKADLTGLEDVKTPTSTASSGKYTVKLKNWKILKFIRKTSDPRQEMDVDVFTLSAPSGEGGYQQVPAIIEANGKNDTSALSVIKTTDPDDLNKEPIDIKSYISQSRSDIGQFEYSSNADFMRGGSYRSQYGRPAHLEDLPYLQRSGSSRSRRGRSPNLECLEPAERCRSATVSNINYQRPKRSLEVPSRLSSIAALDVTNQSRKDSGIKSNSRRSSTSMQQIDTTMLNSEMLQHRVSGYYTSSQCSINMTLPSRNMAPFFDKFGTCIQNLRKQSDRQLIKCVQDNSKSRSSYFIKPPLSKTTLFFSDKEMEKQYRMNVHHIPSREEHAVTTLANSNFNTYLDVVVSIFVFLLVSIGGALAYGITNAWMITFFSLLTLQFLGMALCVRGLVRLMDRIFWCFIRFYRWNFLGAILVSLPLISATVNFLDDGNITPAHLNTFSYLFFVGIMHFCNFTQLNCWMKNIVVSASVVALTLTFIRNPCLLEEGGLSTSNESFGDFPVSDSKYSDNTTEPFANERHSRKCFFYKSEFILNELLLVILVWMLTREFEIGKTYSLM
nr:unnamed protein product [Callosobruchus analis]